MNGFFLIDKPSGMTSRDVVNMVSKTYREKKVGHAGTLDPLATGVLIVAIGRATKLLPILTNHDKTYQVTVQIGKSTDTLDITGEVLETSNQTCSKERIEEALSHFVGTYNQEVPKYSAVSIAGKRLYQYAREGKEIVLPSRQVTIDKIDLNDYQEQEFTFTVSVSKGTYIRSLVRDIGIFLACPMTISKLRRLKQGNVTIDQCISLETITDRKQIQSYSDLFSEIPCYEIKEEDLLRVKNGNAIHNPHFRGRVFLTHQKKIIALYKEKKDQLICEVMLEVKK